MQQQNGSADKKQSGLSWSTPAGTKSLPTVAATPTSFVGRYVGIFVAGVLVGVLVSWGYSAATGTKTGTAASTTKSTQGTKATGSVATSNGALAGVRIGDDGMVADNAALSVPASQKAGLSVAITNVSVSKPTWVVVYESQAGKPGNVLGAHLFFESGKGTITLLRATVAGQEYLVGTSPDDGDRKYAKAVDKPTATEDGTIVVTPFTAN